MVLHFAFTLQESLLSLSVRLVIPQAKEFDRAIEEFKAFERKDTYLKTRAATNLSFLYFLEGDMAQVSLSFLHHRRVPISSH